MENTLIKISVDASNRQIIDRLPESADSLVTSIFHGNKTQTLLIANDSFHATRLQQELKIFSPNIKSAILPDYGILPYERHLVAKEVIASRLLTLWQLNHDILDVVIIPNNILNAKLPPIEYINSRIFSLKINERLSTEELRHRLINGSYTLVDQVYEHGDFAIRGGIIDIIPMGAKNIIRIELFDDEIESLKLLNIKSRENIGTVDSFELIPAKEYPTNSESLSYFADSFNQKFSNVSLKLLQDIKYGILPPGSEFYLPLFFTKTNSIFDYFNGNYQIIYNDKTLHFLEHNWQDIKNRYNHFNYQYPCLKPSELYLTSEEVFAEIKKQKSFYFTTDGNLEAQFNTIPDISVTHTKNSNQFTKLIEFKNQFNGNIVIIMPSAGRLEIMRETLNRYNIEARLIDNISQK
jgi:transcription-repair coupling factor (superfamily II helicase)